jgi:hypothetical protein
VKDSFYEELERVFDKFHMEILLGDFNAEVGKEDIFKPTIGNESLHEISNDNGVRSSFRLYSMCKIHLNIIPISHGFRKLPHRFRFAIKICMHLLSLPGIQYDLPIL